MSDVVHVASTQSNVIAGSITISTTIAGGLTNSILVLRVAGATTSVTRTITDATLDPGGGNETALTMHSRHIQGSGDFATLEIWYLKNPPAGTYNVTANFDGTSVATGVVTIAENVDQTTPWSAATEELNTATSTTPSVDITTAVGELALDMLVGNTTGAGFTADGSQTEDANVNSSGISYALSHRVATGTTTTLSYTATGSVLWYQSGTSLRAAGSAPPPATQLGIDSSPADDTSYTDRTLTFVIEIQDEAGDRVTGATDTVAMGNIVVLSGTPVLTKVIASASAVAGLATLTGHVRSTQGATYTIPFTSGSLTGVSSPTMSGFVRGADIAVTVS